MRVIRKSEKNRELYLGIKFVLTKFAAFGIIYALAAVVMEGMIILLYSALGYDILHGKFPTANWVQLVPLYGFAGFSALTLLYVKLIEKKKLCDIMLVWNKKSIVRFFRNLIFGGVLVSIMIVFLTITGFYQYIGINNIDPVFLVASFVAYLIQGTTEEIMCRGFLLNTLKEKIGLVPAVILSSVAFIAPHMPSVIEMDGFLMVVAIINLCLVSLLFSLVMCMDGSVLSACGLHIGWNFMLGVIFGLQLTGKAPQSGLFSFLTIDYSILTGGSYGIEASLLLIPLLALLDVIFIIRIKRKGADYGISKETVRAQKTKRYFSGGVS